MPVLVTLMRDWERVAAFPVRRLKSTVNKRSSHAGLCSSRKWNKSGENEVHQLISLFRHNSLTPLYSTYYLYLFAQKNIFQT